MGLARFCRLIEYSSSFRHLRFHSPGYRDSPSATYMQIVIFFGSAGKMAHVPEHYLAKVGAHYLAVRAADHLMWGVEAAIGMVTLGILFPRMRSGHSFNIWSPSGHGCHCWLRGRWGLLTCRRHVATDRFSNPHHVPAGWSCSKFIRNCRRNWCWEAVDSARSRICHNWISICIFKRLRHSMVMCRRIDPALQCAVVLSGKTDRNTRRGNSELVRH